MLGRIIDSVEEFFLKLFEKVGLKNFTNYYREHKEGMRYLVFGGLTTVINWIVAEYANSFFKLSTTLSNVIAWIVAVIFAYITNKFFVFYSKNDNKKDLLKEIISFLGARIATLVIETKFLNIVVDILGFDFGIMKIISNIFVIILNYVFSKLFIFSKMTVLKREQNKQKEN